MSQLVVYGQVSAPRVPEMAEVCEYLRPLPPEGVMLGIDSNWFSDRENCLPVLFDVSATYSPNIIVWDRVEGQGLKLLKTAIEYILKYKKGGKYQTEFVIMSNNTREWSKLTSNELGVWDKNACVAVVPFWDAVSDQVMKALSDWCLNKQSTVHPTILFVDGLENVNNMSEESQEHFRRILSCGRSRNIYIIVSAKFSDRSKLAGWFEYFQREVFGRNVINWFEFDERITTDVTQTLVFFCPSTEI